MDKRNIDKNKESGDEEQSGDDISKTTHGIPIDNLAQLYLNFETETDASVGSETTTSNELEVIDD